MVEFARYYINFIRDFFANIGEFFKRIFEAFADLLFNDVAYYFRNFINSSSAFGLLDWVIAFIVLLINIAFVVFLVLKGVQLLRRYFKFNAKEIEKDELLEEITFLNQKTIELIDEKNKILALKVNQIGGAPVPADGSFAGGSTEQEEKAAYKGPSHFVKLIK